MLRSNIEQLIFISHIEAIQNISPNKIKIKRELLEINSQLVKSSKIEYPECASHTNIVMKELTLQAIDPMGCPAGPGEFVGVWNKHMVTSKSEVSQSVEKCLKLASNAPNDILEQNTLLLTKSATLSNAENVFCENIEENGKIYFICNKCEKKIQQKKGAKEKHLNSKEHKNNCKI